MTAPREELPVPDTVTGLQGAKEILRLWTSEEGERVW